VTNAASSRSEAFGFLEGRAGLQSRLMQPARRRAPSLAILVRRQDGGGRGLVDRSQTFVDAVPSARDMFEHDPAAGRQLGATRESMAFLGPLAAKPLEAGAVNFRHQTTRSKNHVGP
jgi:hypothetical protein